MVQSLNLNTSPETFFLPFSHRIEGLSKIFEPCVEEPLWLSFRNAAASETTEILDLAGDDEFDGTFRSPNVSSKMTPSEWQELEVFDGGAQDNDTGDSFFDTWLTRESNFATPPEQPAKERAEFDVDDCARAACDFTRDNKFLVALLDVHGEDFPENGIDTTDSKVLCSEQDDGATGTLPQARHFRKTPK